MARNRQQALWTSDRRLYLDAAGKIVEKDNPARVTLLVAAGGTIPMEQAVSLGLAEAPTAVDPDEAAVTTRRSGKGPRTTRAVVAPGETKPLTPPEHKDE